MRRLAIAAAAALSPAMAAAHGGERGFVLLLPTGHYLAGGAAAVAASFLVLAAMPAGWVRRAAAARLRLALPAWPAATLPSLASFGLLLALLAAGIWGSRDPLANPLPLAVWTLWWAGLTLLHALLGNLWAFLNPWTGPYRLLDRLAGGRLSRAPPLAWPARLGYLPAILLFAGFAWLELVDPAPDDPARLACLVAVYWLLAFAGMLLFGEPAWTARAEPFSIFFRLVGGLSPLVAEAGEGRLRLSLALPGAALLARPPLPPGGILFVLLTLAAVTFDGLSRTFWWLALGDVNPLEFPGRSAVMGRNTAGLAATVLVLVLLYGLAVAGGWLLAGRHGSLRILLGSFVHSVVPISIAYHFAHYLTALMVDGQYALLAASDPFGRGDDLLGLGHRHVTTSFLSTHAGAQLIWNLQTAAIVGGHVAAVWVAHALALRHFGDARRAAVSQLPLAALMVLYTLFGLWLLSTPAIG